MQITTLLQEEDPKTDPETEKIKITLEEPMKGKETQVMIDRKDQRAEKKEKEITEGDQMKEETHKDLMNQETEAPALTNQGQTAEKTKETLATTNQGPTVEESITMKEDLLKEEKPKILMTQEAKTKVMRDRTETDHPAMINREQIVEPGAGIMTKEVNIIKQ